MELPCCEVVVSGDCVEAVVVMIDVVDLAVVVAVRPHLVGLSLRVRIGPDYEIAALFYIFQPKGGDLAKLACQE